MRRSLGLYVRIGGGGRLYLFDASSIVNLVKKGVVRPFAYGVTIDLALYEALNAVWKECRLLRRFDKDTALRFVRVLRGVFGAMRVLSIRGLEREVFDLALREGLTVYDASYVCVAIKNGLVLVTDDRELGDRVSKYLRVIDSNEVVKAYRS